MITQAIELVIRQQSNNNMIFSAIILSFVMPLQISLYNPQFEPFIVKAAIDAAVIVGIPSSKAAKQFAIQAQKPDYLMVEANLAAKPVNWRRLYFRKLFS